MSRNDPAFPLNELHQTTGDICAQHFGMTLRGYFAAKAMQALIGCSNLATMEQDAIYAYQQADAMLEARKT